MKENLKKKIIKRCLRDAGCFPVVAPQWQLFELAHGECREEDKKKNRKIIREAARDAKGVYIYKQSRKILYVGKGKSITDRMLSHYRESFEPVPGDTKNKKWHKFFSRHKGKVHIYWMKLEDERERQLIEKMLDFVLNPEFNDFKV